MGPPGAGKTTHGKNLMRWLNIKKRYHVAWYVRTNGKNKFEIQKRRGSFIANVSKEFLEFVKWHAEGKDCVIDGFPRTLEQAKILTRTFTKDQIVLLQITTSAPDFEIWSLKRQASRALRRNRVPDQRLYKAKIKRFLRYEARAISWLKTVLPEKQVYEIDCYEPVEISTAQLKETLKRRGYEI